MPSEPLATQRRRIRGTSHTKMVAESRNGPTYQSEIRTLSL